MGIKERAIKHYEEGKYNCCQAVSCRKCVKTGAMLLENYIQEHQ